VIPTQLLSFEDQKHNKPDEKTLNRQKISNGLKQKTDEKKKDISSSPSKLLNFKLGKT